MFFNKLFITSFKKRINYSIVRNINNSFKSFGNHQFIGEVCHPYLDAVGLPRNTLDYIDWVKNGNEDKVAEAILLWAKDNGASVYCHWFQPLAASGVRHGGSGQVHNSMIRFVNGKPIYEFKGKNLLKGETDGSSFPNGGLRSTNKAGGYLSIDPTSPIFLRGDTIFIPSCFFTYNGDSIDEKIPLHRSSEQLSKEGTRLLNLLGMKNVKRVDAKIGLEQEFFLVPRNAYMKRPDLQMTGRTVLGRLGPRGQEMCDHYMSPPSTSSSALACMQEIQNQCFKMGIPLRTRHREVAPNQYEFAPEYGSVTTQIDHNVFVMQIIEEVSVKYGLAALLQEKPFSKINGSGKHNNWSLATDDGTNLLNFKQLEKASNSKELFPIIMAAIIEAYSENGDLMRLSIASPGNDFRLGACEAPPSIMSMYLGEDLTSFLESYINSEEAEYNPIKKTVNLGSSTTTSIEIPAQDRNRTSPFPFSGHRFEFRSVGSSQNVSLVNTVLATITAKAFKNFSDQIEKGVTPREVAQKSLKKSWNVIFNGDNYDVENQKKLAKKGISHIDSTVEAITCFTNPKYMNLFKEMKVFSNEECKSRQQIMLNHYIGTIEMECLCMIDMIQQHIIPSCNNANMAFHSDELLKFVMLLKDKLSEIHLKNDIIVKAELSRKLRLETMIQVRILCDNIEEICPANLWTLSTYNELLFLDHYTI